MMSTKQCQKCANGFFASSYFSKYCHRCQIEIVAEREGITYEEAEMKFENFGLEE